MCGWDIVESEDSVAELKEEVGTEGDECPEWELGGKVSLFSEDIEGSCEVCSCCIRCGMRWYGGEFRGSVSTEFLYANYTHTDLAIFCQHFMAVEYEVVKIGLEEDRSSALRRASQGACARVGWMVNMAIEE